jgi:predicted permease
VLQAFLGFFVLLGLGYLARRTRRFPDSAAETLNGFVIDVCLPALVLRLVPTLELRWELVLLAATPWAMALVSFLAVAAGQRAFGWDRATRTALFLCTALGNTAFLGFPMVSALLGERMLPLAVVYDQLGSFLLLSTAGPLAIASATSGARPAPFAMLRKVVAFPPFIALIVALLPLPRPALLDGVLTMISSALVPAAIFAVGLRMRITPPPERSAFAFGLLLKLAVLPACALGLAHALGAAAEVRAVMVVQSGMPAMITAGALAAAAGLAPELAAALVGWGIVLAPATLALWAALVG